MAQEKDPYAAGEPDDVFVAPPTSPDDIDDDFAEPPGWPKPVGIISIIWGSLGVVCTGGGTAMQTLSSSMLSGSIEGPLPPMVTNPPIVIYVSGAMAALWGVFLIVCGAVTVNRKPVGRTMHLVYSVVAIVLITWGLYIGFQMQAEMAQWIKDNPDTQYAQMQGTGAAIGMTIGIAVSFVRYIWPVFCLIWFGLIKTKPEQMTGGVESPAA